MSDFREDWGSPEPHQEIAEGMDCSAAEELLTMENVMTLSRVHFVEFIWTLEAIWALPEGERTNKFWKELS